MAGETLTLAELTKLVLKLESLGQKDVLQKIAERLLNVRSSTCGQKVLLKVIRNVYKKEPQAALDLIDDFVRLCSGNFQRKIYEPFKIL